MITQRILLILSLLSVAVFSETISTLRADISPKGAAVLFSMTHCRADVEHRLDISGLPSFVENDLDSSIVLKSKSASKGAEWLKWHGRPKQWVKKSERTNYHSRLTMVGKGKSRRVRVEVLPKTNGGN